MKLFVPAVGAVLIAALAGCARDARVAPVEKSAEGAHAAPGAPDDWCAEHQVPESMCTQCNPALVASFRAKGDWCPEHGLPESVCPVCHPELRRAPAGAAAAGDGPADGTLVRFKTPETARIAGIETRAAVEGSAGSAVAALAHIVYDATRVAEVNARAGGVVRSIVADVGAHVRSGGKLAAIESAALGAEQSRATAAAARVRFARSNHERLERLHGEGVASEQDLALARQELDTAQAEEEAARAALGTVESATGGSPVYPLTSPIGGIVTKRNVTLGRVVTTEEVLFVVVNTSVVWAEIDVPEADAALLGIGSGVTVTIDTLAGRTFEGELAYLAPEVDAHTRTVKGRVVLPNPDGVLRANQFGRARIAHAAAGGEVLVPRDAIQRAGGSALVFVRLADDLYETRRVGIGADSGELVAVRGHLRAGEAVVTQGSFFLKTETLRESIGAGCCD